MLTAEQKRSLEKKGIEWRRLDVVPGSFAVASVARGEGVIADVRQADPFQEHHFPDAVNCPGDQALLTLPRDKDISLYCT